MSARAELPAPRRLYERLANPAGAGDGPVALAFLDAHGELREWTRRDLFGAAEAIGARLARGWEELGGGPGGIAAVLAGTQEQQVLHYLAVLSAGLVPAILTPPNRKLERSYYLDTMVGVLERIAPTLVVTDLGDELEAAAEDGARALPSMAALESAEISHSGGGERREVPDGTAFVQFSSGTTGIKKGVVVRTEAAESQLRTYGEAIAIEPGGDCIVSWLPLYHDMGFITALHLPLAFGVRCVMLEPLDWVAAPASYLQAVSRFGATLGWHPNFAYAFMASRVRDRDLEGVDLSSLRGLVNCAEPVRASAQEAFATRYAGHGLRPGVFWGCYAMAEATYAVTHAAGVDEHGLDPEGPSGATGFGERLPMVSVGRPLLDVRVEVRDEDGGELADGELGELWVGAPFLADGYVADPDATAAAFRDGWYRTGDLGYRRGGLYYVTGRAKDMLIVAGENIFPEDVEAIVSMAEGVREGRVAAFGVFDERAETERIVVLAEYAEDPAAVDVIEVRRHLVAELQVASVLLELVEPEWLVKSSSGKIARKASASKWLAARAAAQVGSAS